MLKTFRIQSQSRAWLFLHFAQPPAQNLVLLYHYIVFLRTTIITLVAKSATLVCAWLTRNFQFCYYFGKADWCGWQPRHLHSISEARTMPINLYAWAHSWPYELGWPRGDCHPTARHIHSRVINIPWELLFCMPFSCLQLFSTECRHCGLWQEGLGGIYTLLFCHVSCSCPSQKVVE